MQAVEGEQIVSDTILPAGKQFNDSLGPFRTLEIRWKIGDLGKLSKGENPLWSFLLQDADKQKVCCFQFAIDFDGTRYGFNDDKNENSCQKLTVVTRGREGDRDETIFAMAGSKPDRFSTLKLVYDGFNVLEIYSGPDKYSRIGKVVVDEDMEMTAIQADKSLIINSINLTPLSSLRKSLETGWTTDALRHRFEDLPVNLDGNDLSVSHLEGIYRYLDSELEMKKVGKGGDYRLYLMPSADKGFDIIYLDGATSNAKGWKAGMLKGRLRPTIFDNHYNVEWYDARFNNDYEECWAEFQAGPILTIHFPVEASVLRFYRERR